MSVVHPADCMVGALAMLAAIQPTPRAGETVEARFIAPDGQPPIRRFYRSREGLLADAARLAPTRHVYVGVALREGHDGTARGVSRTGAAWAEVDAKLWADAPHPKAAAFDAIRAFPAPPSVVVDTWGGYHTYWPLAEPLNVHTDGAAPGWSSSTPAWRGRSAGRRGRPTTCTTPHACSAWWGRSITSRSTESRARWCSSRAARSAAMRWTGCTLC